MIKQKVLRNKPDRFCPTRPIRKAFMERALRLAADCWQNVGRKQNGIFEKTPDLGFFKSIPDKKIWANLSRRTTNLYRLAQNRSELELAYWCGFMTKSTNKVLSTTINRIEKAEKK